MPNYTSFFYNKTPKQKTFRPKIKGILLKKYNAKYEKENNLIYILNKTILNKQSYINE